MKNLVITSARTFNEDSCIRIKGKVEVDNAKCKFVLETDERGRIDIDGITGQLLPQLVAAILEIDPDLDCYLE
jgi:hypothetical protein